MQPVPREHLCFLFWPNQSEIKARRNLTHLLTHLRRAMPDCEDLITGEDQVALNPDRVWSDTTVAEHRIADYSRRPSSYALERITSLFHGLFMAGFSLPDAAEFESWLMLERCVWERYYLRALELLVESQVADGLFPQAIGYAQRYLAVNHLDEEMHCRLMELYAVTGNRAAALQQYRICADALGRELGIAPLTETKALYLSIMQGELSFHTELEPRSALTLIPEGHVYPLNPLTDGVEGTVFEPAMAYVD
jgi:DNA-binding SARP family transcriptional activator